MNKVYQTRFGKYSGNCFPACISFLLHIPIESIPNFCASNSDTWYLDFLWWLGEHGFSSIEFNIDSLGDWKPANGQLCYLCGKSPRGDFDHAVVGCFEDGVFHVIHDPHPSGDGLDDQPKSVGFFFPTIILNNE